MRKCPWKVPSSLETAALRLYADIKGQRYKSNIKLLYDVYR